MKTYRIRFLNKQVDYYENAKAIDWIKVLVKAENINEATSMISIEGYVWFDAFETTKEIE